MTPEEATAKIRKAAELGNITFAEGKEEAFNRITLGKPDFTVTKVDFAGAGKLKDNAGGWFGFEWETQSAGFGSTTFFIYNDGRVEIENECMGKEFIASVLMKFLETAKLMDERP